VNNEILEKYMGKDQNIYGMGLGWATVDGKSTGFGESKKEERVVLTVDESVAQEYVNKFYNIYGDYGSRGSRWCLCSRCLCSNGLILQQFRAVPIHGLFL